jgi:FecR protein
MISAWVGLALMLIVSSVAGAGVVGHVTLMEGRVDLLKGGNLPAIAVKVGDTVEPGDVIRTKSLSKAQITFIDDSTLTLSPEARLAIEDFKFEPSQGKRRAVLEVFQGLALAVVNKILKAEEPDFVVKTQTAIVGVRGTEFGIRIQPNSSTILNFSGRVQVGNILPAVSRRFLKAFKVAYAWNSGSSQWVFLNDMQGTTVARNMPPTAPFTLTPEDRLLFMRQLNTFVATQGQLPQGPVPPFIEKTTLPPVIPDKFLTPGAQDTLNILNTLTVPPTVVPVPQTPPPPPPPHRRDQPIPETGAQ